ncbi:MAG: replication-associated recombination protein A, partial [Erysipelotrichaceae bacterium]|nr:replication-associated recombination protein A [Erysipelotrichaceae bacterium]
TPIGLEEEEKYDYGSPHKWHKIQYLPDEIKDVRFYEPNTNSTFESALASNEEKLRKIPRTNKLSTLK